MLFTLVEILPEAFAIAFNPLAVIVIVLLLTGWNGRRKAMAYIAGWVGGLVVISLAVYFIVDANRGPRSLLAPYLPTLRLLLALQFFGLAVYELFLIKKRKQGEIPRRQWFERLSKFNPLQVFILAAGMAALSVKNVGLVLSAGSSMIHSGLFGLSTWLIFVLFVCLGSGPIIAPLVYVNISGSMALGRLKRWRDWLIAYNAHVMFVLSIILGTKLLLAGLSG